MCYIDRHGVCMGAIGRSICAGFEKPSASQQKGIVPITKNLDVVLQANYGTGKVATFCIGILQNLVYSVVQCQALVLTSTRERAHQIERMMRSLGSYTKVKCRACVGGTLMREDKCILRGGVHVVVGTPDRLVEILNWGGLQLARAPIFFVDEADYILSGGFNDQLFEIISLLPEMLQVISSTSYCPTECVSVLSQIAPVTCQSLSAVVAHLQYFC
jgi:translation initiation factor 4A